jgi:hypothetical protein
VLTRVYLDQWVWIRLARAALGRPKDPQDADVLAMVRESVRLGLASYPLSPVHCKELAAGASPRQGHELAPVIAEISRHHTMIGPGNDVLSEELDRCFHRRFGRPAAARAVQVFGQGFGHAFGDGDRFRPRLVADDGGPPPVAPGVRHQLEDLAAEMTKYFKLAGLPEGVVVPGYDPRAHTAYDRQFADQERELARLLAAVPRAGTLARRARSPRSRSKVSCSSKKNRSLARLVSSPARRTQVRATHADLMTSDLAASR